MTDQKAQLEGWMAKFQSPERMVRQRGLKEFLEFCETGLTTDNVVEIFDTVYLHIIRCYNDKYEMCRSLACSIVSEILKYLQRNDYFLNYIVPVIAKRIGQAEVLEESEEMRLQMLQQLNYIIEKYKELINLGSVKDYDGKDVMLKPYNEIMDILKMSLFDTYPAVLKETCEIIINTANACTSFHYRAEVLLDPLSDLLRHRHSIVRISAVKAIGIACLHIHSNGDYIQKMIKNVSPLLMDSVPYVRREVGRTGCLWLQTLRDRYSYFERLLPLALCCLSDETLEVRNEIQEQFNLAGELYFTENELELQKLVLIDQQPEHYPADIKRPTLGCRALVQRSLNVLNIVLHEMEDWKEDVRLHSTKLLKQIVIHSESFLATKYYDINAVLCKTCNDSDNVVAQEALQVSRLIGTFVDFKTWSKHIQTEMNMRQNKLGPLKCFRAMFENSKDNERWRGLMETTKMLMETPICHNSDVKFQLELLDLLKIILDGLKNVKNEESYPTIEKNLYIVILKTTSVSFEAPQIKSVGSDLLEQLRDGQDLHSKYLKSALDTLDAIDGENTDISDQVLILHGLICLCGFQKSYLDDLKKVILVALEHSSPEGKIKVFSGIAVAALRWDLTIGASSDVENLMILNRLIDEMILPHLIWHAGKSAESVRSMAAATLCSLAQGTSRLVIEKLLSSLSVQLTSLVDDNSVATRNYTMRVLQHIGPLNYEQLKLLASAVLYRLDDPSAEVREKAAKVLGLLVLDEETLKDEIQVKSWHELLKQILPTMLIHLESPEVNLRSALMTSFGALAQRNKEVFQNALIEMGQSPDKVELEKLLVV